DEESGISKVIFFVGRPIDGKIPPTVPQAEAKLDAASGAWTAQLQLAGDRRGPTDLSVQFINGVGQSTFGSTAVMLLDSEKKTGPGRIVGTVKEGENPQPEIEVSLAPVQDPKAPMQKPTKTTKTKPDGTFVFEDVGPGRYTLSCTKIVSGRAAS